MSIRCQSWVYEYSEATGNDRLILLAIADEADDDGTNAYPGIDRISHKARVPKRTTMRCIERLEAGGHLVVIRPEVKGRGRFNTYRVIMDPPQGNGATVTPIPEDPDPDPEKARNGARKARKGAQPYLNGPRPIDPLTQNPTTTTPPPPSTDLAVPAATHPVRQLPHPAAFEAFYAAYPLHVGKAAAARAWPKALHVAGGDFQRIVDGAMRYRNDPNRDPAFTAHPATWLNAGRWDDDPLPPRNSNGGRPTSKVDQRAAEALERLRRRQEDRPHG